MFAFFYISYKTWQQTPWTLGKDHRTGACKMLWEETGHCKTNIQALISYILLGSRQGDWLCSYVRKWGYTSSAKVLELAVNDLAWGAEASQLSPAELAHCLPWFAVEQLVQAGIFLSAASCFLTLKLTLAKPAWCFHSVLWRICRKKACLLHLFEVFPFINEKNMAPVKEWVGQEQKVKWGGVIYHRLPH